MARSPPPWLSSLPLPVVTSPTSSPPALTPTPAATSPAPSPSPDAPSGRSKALRWCHDTPPSGKSGGGVTQPTFKEVLLANIATQNTPATASSSPSATVCSSGSPPRLVARLRDSLLSDCYSDQSTRGVPSGRVSGWGSQDQELDGNTKMQGLR